MTTHLDTLLAPVSFDAELRRIFHAGPDPLVEARAAITAWDLTPLALLGQGAIAICLLCRDSKGHQLVLKAGADTALLASEYAALTIWASTGLFPVPLPVPTATATPAAFMMEQLPGTPPHPTADLTHSAVLWLTEQACALWSRWQLPAPPMLTDAWAEVSTPAAAFARRIRWCTRRATPDHRPSLALLAVAHGAALSLSASAPTPGLCHGDFSHRNLLLDGPLATRPAVAVCDPMGYIGDPLADLAHWTVTCNTDLTGRLSQVALAHIRATLPIDPQRLYRWAVIAAVLEANLAPTHPNAALGWLANYGPAPTDLAPFLSRQ